MLRFDRPSVSSLPLLITITITTTVFTIQYKLQCLYSLRARVGLGLCGSSERSEFANFLLPGLFGNFINMGPSALFSRLHRRRENAITNTRSGQGMQEDARYSH